MLNQRMLLCARSRQSLLRRWTIYLSLCASFSLLLPVPTTASLFPTSFLLCPPFLPPFFPTPSFLSFLLLPSPFSLSSRSPSLLFATSLHPHRAPSLNPSLPLSLPPSSSSSLSLPPSSPSLSLPTSHCLTLLISFYRKVVYKSRTQI